ncbi:uncharacterized protein A4U43_C08F12420 [Asparagus officinalis]|uniref:peamaclein-like n=1 Tax=Asparagus officinalis TaxID=4686 RepID=UPI00098E467B|nr:peamaclein-like [Asparagus officinalis]ONK59931.1 uncharacterized protein A4U43_C08F12420 [Asparagus officinalis]
MKPLTATLAILLLLFTSSFLQVTMAGSAFCDSKCKVRCSKAGVQKRCLYFCGICCEKCHCVPPGTYGNKDACPCYRDLLSSKKTPKCP